MTRALPATILLSALISGCGAPEDPAIGRFGFDLTLASGLAATVTELQVAVLPHGSEVICSDVEKTCLSTLYPDTPLLLKAADGRSVKTLNFPADLSTGVQTVTATGVPVGKDYAIVVEALAQDSLVGSSCTYRPEGVSSGTNSVLSANVVAISPPPTCNPRF